MSVLDLIDSFVQDLGELPFCLVDQYFAALSEPVDDSPFMGVDVSNEIVFG